jgi:outer membrane protein, heavy metal efflux system
MWRFKKMHTKERIRASRLRSILGIGGIAAVALLAGCARVRPQEDYQQARTRIAQQTGVDGAYDPESDDLVAQNVEGLLTDGLTIEEAVRVALLNNRALQALFGEIGAAKADFVQSKLLSNPTLALGVMFPEGGGRSKLSGGIAQELADLWQIPVRKKIARKQLEATVLKVVDSAVNLVAQTKAKYFQLAAVEETQTLVAQEREFVDHSLKLARMRFDAGETSILDVHLVRAALLDLQRKQVTLDQNLLTARAQLAHLLGLGAHGDTWQISEGVPATPKALGSDVDLLVWAMDHRVDTQAARMAVAGAEEQVRKQRRAIFPSVVLGLDVERSEMRGPKSLPFNPLGSLPGPGGGIGQLTVPQNATQLTQAYRDRVAANSDTLRGLRRDYLLNRLDEKRARDFEKKQNIDVTLGPSLQVTLPVFDQNRAQIAKARFELWQKQKEFEELLQTVAEEVRITAAAASGAEELQRLFEEESLPLAEGNIDTAHRVYAAGEADILVVLGAQEALMRVREALVSARQDNAAAVALLERALGGRLPDDGENAANQADEPGGAK